MRTIKFRGYAHHQDKWVYGSLLLDGGEAWVTETEQGLFVDMNHQMKLEPVEPETVGQFTGLTDKNGKEIYEGDLIRFSDRIGVVTWHTPSAQFDTELVKITQRALYTENRENDQWKRFEVIGNIHENPELLK